MRKILAAACALSVTACTWVEPSPQGRAVTLAQPVHVANCQSLGSVTASTRQDGRELLELAAKIPLRPQVQLFPLEEANQALELLKAGKIDGAAVLAI